MDAAASATAWSSITVLFAGAAVFWGVFEQAGSTLTIFADESTRQRRSSGTTFPSSWWQSLNAVLIILLAPFFSWLWVRLGDRNPSYPTKFGIGLAFVGLGFLALVGGANQWTGDLDRLPREEQGGDRGGRQGVRSRSESFRRPPTRSGSAS